MINVFNNLWVGNMEDLKQPLDWSNWAIIHACKEPFHRELLGYTTLGAPKDNPEYLVARRDLILYLNLIDAPKPEYIPEEIINTAIDFIDEHLKQKRNVFVHCNQGESRAPGITLLYLISKKIISEDPETILKIFQAMYPNYNPGEGMRLFIENRFKELE